jgi:hypothetical protein
MGSNINNCIYNFNYLNKKIKILDYFRIMEIEKDITQQNVYNYVNYNYILLLLFFILLTIYFIMVLKKAN